MKKSLSLLILILVLPSILALNIQVDKETNQAVLVQGFDNPAIFNLKITNFEEDSSFKLMNFLGFVTEPETFEIKEGQIKDLTLKVYPRKNFDYLGFYIFKYSIFQGEEEFKDELILKIIEFQDAFNIGATDLDPESNSLEVYVENKENFNFENLHVKFSSAFFNLEEDFNLAPNQKKSFNVKLNKEDFKKLIAGFYTLEAEITAQNQKAELEGIIKFIEKDILTTEKKEFGLIVNSKIIKKENQGNIPVETTTTLQKNIISRLFTSFSPVPDAVERKGLEIYYTWNQKINPGETSQIIVKTNWLLPFLLILIVVAIVMAVKQYSKKNLVVRKKVSFVKTKTGEFALKVTLNLHARKYVEKIRLIDRLPPLVKIYEKFGIEKPIRVDEKSRRIEWLFEKLEAGESRILSYVIYSKVAVLGRFILPSAIAIFEKNGKVHEVNSNSSFFMAETNKHRD